MVKDPELLKLLLPIPGNKPCGEFLRYTEAYDHIREARREENDKLPQGVWKIELKRADWDRVSSLCQEALIHQSKDLQIVAWLTEAWLHLDGIPGLTKGLRLTCELTKKFWKDLHPKMLKGTYELRIIPYEWMDTKLSNSLQYVQIAAPSDKANPSFTYIDYTRANRPKPPSQQTTSSTSEPEADASLSPDKLLLSIKQTPRSFYQEMGKNCSTAQKTIHSLEKLLVSLLKNEAPNFSHLRAKIERLQAFFESNLKHYQENKVMKMKSPAEESKTSAKSKQKHHPELTIKSREQAYQILGEVAAYLEQVEPHSPTPYLIHRAISWGGMTLAEVVQEALQNGQDMSLLLDLLNIKKTSASSSLASPEQQEG